MKHKDDRKVDVVQWLTNQHRGPTEPITEDALQRAVESVQQNAARPQVDVIHPRTYDWLRKNTPA